MIGAARSMDHIGQDDLLQSLSLLSHVGRKGGGVRWELGTDDGINQIRSDKPGDTKSINKNSVPKYTTLCSITHL